VFESALDDILTHPKQWMIVLLALQLTRSFVPHNAMTIWSDPAVLQARGASRDVGIQGDWKFFARRHTAVKEYLEDAHLKMTAAALNATPFAAKMAIMKFLRKLLRRAAITD
jgi:hypothetical protein